MIQTSIKIPTKLRGLGTGSDDLFSRMQMEKLAQIGRDSVVARARRGLGSNDSPMPPLKGGNTRMFLTRVNGKAVFGNQTYAARKIKAGLQGFRDMWGTGKQGGHMLDNFTVRQATPTSAKIAFTSKHQREKAIANERRASFLEWSPANVADVMKAARQMFQSEVQASLGNFPALIRKFRKRAA